jgi:hypothetical protein
MSRPLSVAIGAAVVAAVVAAAAPAALASRTTLRGTAGLSTNYDFARLVLEDGGWPTSANNTIVLTQWLRSEEPTSRWWNRDNPLNNGLGSGGGSGLGSYSSVVVAALDVARNLENPSYGYPLVARDLAASAAPGTTSRAIWRSDWSSGHYGRGADWATEPVPSVTAPSAAWLDTAACPTAYPAGVVGPCGRGFSASGPLWRSGAPSGLRGHELWALSTGARSDGSATWRPTVTPGIYEISAFVPAGFADAVAAYVVHDATGAHRVLLNQEPYRNAWVDLGSFSSSAAAHVVVSLGTSSRSSDDGTYVAADALRFTHVGQAGSTSRRPQRSVNPVLGAPGPPQDVSALAGDRTAIVSWLAPSKDGGRPILSYVATALPGGATCRVVAPETGEPSCAVRGLADGHAYALVVRAVSRLGVGSRSASSSAVRPLHASVVTLSISPKPVFGKRVVYRAVVSGTPTSGVVLFAMDGRLLPGCQNARVVKGHASCATRLDAVGPHDVLTTYSGSEANAGAEAEASLVVVRASTSIRATPSPRAAPAQGVVTLRAWGLPYEARGTLVFRTGRGHLCTAGVKAGSGACTFRLRLGVGLHQVVAEYLGSRDFGRASARTTLLVLRATTHIGGRNDRR